MRISSLCFCIALCHFMGKRKRYFCGRKRAVFKFLKRGARQKRSGIRPDLYYIYSSRLVMYLTGYHTASHPATITVTKIRTMSKGCTLMG